KNPVIQVQDLPEAVRNEQPAAELVNGRLSGPGNNLKAALASPEKQLILDALESHGWNRQDTAAALGINRTTLYKKMKKYGISFESQLMATV
ncbi:MAG: helix-turn-helix domain-containing protein, partial [Planctomycetaceae bacterium]|nr:helix-turn-helix domain-containing protein [Planctomycetaceae bacterium]